jgi:hypothetical protein
VWSTPGIASQAKVTYLDYKKIKEFDGVGYFLENYVVDGAFVTKNVYKSDYIDITEAQVNLKGQFTVRAATSLRTSAKNATYYLDFKDGDFTFATSHPSGTVNVDYLQIATVTTDSNGTVSTITDNVGDRGGFRLKPGYEFPEIAELQADNASRAINVMYPPNGLTALVADDSTDNATAIQAMIDYLVTLKGGKLFFPVGNFKFGTTLTWPKSWPIELEGAGIDATVLHYSGTDDAFNIVGISGTMVVKSGITNMRITGNASALNGIDLQYAYSFYMRNVSIDTFTNGIRTQNSWKILFDFVTVTQCTAQGIILSDDSNNVTLIGCEFFNVGNAGVFVNGGRSVNVISCTLESNKYGAYVTSDANGTSHSIEFYDCYIEGNTTNDIIVTKADGVAPTAINIRDCYFVCMSGGASLSVRLEHAISVTVDGCYFSDGTSSYLHSLYNSDGATLTNIKFGFNQDSSDNGVYQGTGTSYYNEARQHVKAWGRFTVAGGDIATINAFGVQSIAYIEAGTYEVTLKEAMVGTDSCILVTAENRANYNLMLASAGQPTSTTVFRIYTGTSSSTLADARTVSFNVTS